MATRRGRRGDGTTTDRVLTPEEEADQTADDLRLARGNAIERTRAYFLTLLATDYPDLDTFEEVRTLQWIHTSMAPAARSSELQTAAQRFVYARNKIGEIRTMDEATADAYDPAADPGWP